jgi:D-hydroxyproline dehydrogenase subunit beta
MPPTFDVAVIGAGVLGLFHAYHAAKAGFSVALFERGNSPNGASVRNFGMCIPGALKPGIWRERGLESVALYQQLKDEIGLPLQSGGTQYLATTPLEQTVIREWSEMASGLGYSVEYLDAKASTERNPCIRNDSVQASLVMLDDYRFDPRELPKRLIPHLVDSLRVDYHPKTIVHSVQREGQSWKLETNLGDRFIAQNVFICSGWELKQLFPDRLNGLQYCKLQMLRSMPQQSLQMQGSIASGLSIRRYDIFQLAPSAKRWAEEPIDPELTRWGIHLLFAQDADGKMVIGDSHEYDVEEFPDTLNEQIDELILNEAKKLIHLPTWKISDRWHGVYVINPKGELFVDSVERGLHLVNGIGGKGMTTGPAVARENIEQLLKTL